MTVSLPPVSVPLVATPLPGVTIPPIQINVTVVKEEKKQPAKQEKEVKAGFGQLSYILINAAIHANIACATNGAGQAIYYPAYATATVAGTAFGFYKAMQGKPAATLDKEAAAFAKGSLSDKAWNLFENAIIKGPGAMIFAESFRLADNISAGFIVAAYWGFKGGVEIGNLVHKNILSDSK